MNKFDMKYIFRRVLTFFIIFVLLSFIKSCNVHAATYNMPYSDIEINNSNWFSTYGYYGTTFSTSGTSINFDIYMNESNYPFGADQATAIVADVCVSTGFAEVTRSYGFGTSCPNSCFTQNPYYLDLKTSCKYNNNDTGFLFRVFMPVLKWNYGAGCGQTGCHPTLSDNITFKANSYNGTITFMNIYITDELIGTNYNQNLDIINSQINAAQSQAHQDAQQAHQDSQNTQNAINDAKNQAHQDAQQAHQDSQDLKNSLTDTSSPNNLSALNNSAGWLPAGPVDSILNLPLSLLNNLSSNLSKSCQPVVLPIPLINSNLTLPCVKTLYHDMGIDTFINWVGGIASAFILLAYLLKLYKWVDDTLTFRENNQIDNWGGI